ncbi:MAG: AraC family transcriptional regulator [Pedobacter sp.]|nr:MAG: AraC family transcriptional regulator [Pedobacter sp.]
MINYFKYLPVSQEDENWGLAVLNAGCTHVNHRSEYPFQNHPASYNFDWNSWRTLDEYQLIYITNGQGVFESGCFQKTVVKAGTLILLFPNEKHRYKPDENTGWDEYWIGVKGPIMDKLLYAGYFKTDNPCLFIGFNDIVFDLYNQIIDNTKDEKPGYQPMISGAVLHLLGVCHAAIKIANAGTKEEELIINKARLLFRSNIFNAYSAQQAASELCVGYSSFRKLFKSYTGLSPGQYYLQLKIEKAKNMLTNTNLSVKQISYELNFESNFYFSKIFKEKTGLRPTEYRKQSTPSH